MVETQTERCEQGMTDMERELSFYDGSNFSECESEKHVPGVSPRAFNTEIGYNLSIEQIPSKLGQIIRSTIGTPALTLVQTFGNGDFNGREDEFEDMLDRKAYRQVMVYRIDSPGDEPIFERWANGGWLIEYSAFGDSEIDDRPHNETTGYYYGTHKDVSDMVKNLLFDETHDEWVVGRVDDKRMLHSDTWYRIQKQSHMAHGDVL